MRDAMTPEDRYFRTRKRLAFGWAAWAFVTILFLFWVASS
jgi:hypothetical protein